jgi:hypothetical protein
MDLLIEFIAEDTDDIVLDGILLSGEEIPKKLSMDCFDNVKFIWMQRLK